MTFFHGPLRRPRESPSSGLLEEQTRSNHGLTSQWLIRRHVRPMMTSPEVTLELPLISAAYAPSLSM